VELPDVGLQERLLALVGAEPGDQRVLPDADEDVAVKEEADAAEHLFLFNAFLAGEGFPDAGSEGFIEGHGPPPTSPTKSQQAGPDVFPRFHRNLDHFIGCFPKNSHIRSLAETFLVALPRYRSGCSRPGQVCPPPSITTRTTSAPPLPPP